MQRIQKEGSYRKIILKLVGVEVVGWLSGDPYSRSHCRGSGRLRTYVEPVGQGENEFVRVDSGVEEGSSISIYYDPLIAKVKNLLSDFYGGGMFWLMN